MVRVPVSSATWATWKRYCDAVGQSMGRAMAALIDHELASTDGGSSGGAGSLLEEQAQRRLADREAALTKRADAVGSSADLLPDNGRTSAECRTLSTPLCPMSLIAMSDLGACLSEDRTPSRLHCIALC
jgi:hypothetical protein